MSIVYTSGEIRISAGILEGTMTSATANTFTDTTKNVVASRYLDYVVFIISGQ